MISLAALRRWLPAACAALALGSAAPAGAATSVPASFFGANWDAEIAVNSSEEAQYREWARMKAAGVHSTRAPFEWVKIEPERRQYDFSTSDRLVRLAAVNQIELLPVVIYAPRWARERPGNFSSPPQQPEEYAQFLKVLIARYGPSGSFWVEHPEIEWRPVRHWQIWNEPHLAFQWDETPGDDWANDYGVLLKQAFTAIREADPGAKVVLAGLANRSYTYLSTLYRRGKIRGSFDIAALHPYTVEPKGVVELTRRFRGVMERARDRRKRLWITELGLPASRGRFESKSSLQTTDRGMAKFLSGSYDATARARRSSAKRVDRVYWYTWASLYCCEQFRFTGLLQYDNQDGVTAKPAFRSYRRAVLRLRAKGSSARGNR